MKVGKVKAHTNVTLEMVPASGLQLAVWQNSLSYSMQASGA